MRTCDMFCRVIDNYGDAGVSWRLARMLAREAGWAVLGARNTPSSARCARVSPPGR